MPPAFSQTTAWMPELAQPSGTPPVLDRDALCAAGRTPPVPFRFVLRSGVALRADEILRVLPGKRIVVRTTLEGRAALAKLYIGEGSARHWQRERNGIEVLTGAGLPTPNLILAESLASGGEVILTEFLEDSKTLRQDWQALTRHTPGSDECLAVLEPAFELLGHLHFRGITHEDLHLGNFLRHGSVVHVIDGDTIRKHSDSPLPLDSARVNLALLVAQLPMAWDEALLPLLTAYHRGNPHWLPEPGELAGPIERARARRLSDYLGKVGRDCSRFRVDRRFDRLLIVARADEGALGPLTDDPDAAITAGDRLKNGGTCTVARVPGKEREFVIKRYNLKNWRHALSRLWRPSRAWHSWVEGHRLCLLGIPTPPPCAVIEERRGPLRGRAWLFTEHCAGLSLDKHLDPAAEPPEREAEALRRLFRTLTRARISHGDLKASNLIWSNGELYLIDLDAMRQHHSAAAHRRAWARDRNRLMRNWPQGSPLRCWFDSNLPR